MEVIALIEIKSKAGGWFKGTMLSRVAVTEDWEAVPIIFWNLLFLPVPYSALCSSFYLWGRCCEKNAIGNSGMETKQLGEKFTVFWTLHGIIFVPPEDLSEQISWVN